MSPGALLLVALVMAAGLTGTVVPLLPGLPLIWAAALGYGLLAGFGPAGGLAFAAISVLLVAGGVARYVLPHRAARSGGAPRSTLLAGAAGALVGFFALPVLGLPLGAVLAVLLAERRRLGEWSAARVTTSTVLRGFGVGVLVEVLAGVLMIACWIAWVLTSR